MLDLNQGLLWVCRKRVKWWEREKDAYLYVKGFKRKKTLIIRAFNGCSFWLFSWNSFSNPCLRTCSINTIMWSEKVLQLGYLKEHCHCQRQLCWMGLWISNSVNWWFSYAIDLFNHCDWALLWGAGHVSLCDPASVLKGVDKKEIVL